MKVVSMDQEAINYLPGAGVNPGVQMHKGNVSLLGGGSAQGIRGFGAGSRVGSTKNSRDDLTRQEKGQFIPIPGLLCLRPGRSHPAEPSTPGCLHHPLDQSRAWVSRLVKTSILAEPRVEADALSGNYKFGFKKWKSHVTAQPWSDPSEIVTRPPGKLCWHLAGYLLWPFDKVIQKEHFSLRLCKDAGDCDFFSEPETTPLLSHLDGLLKTQKTYSNHPKYSHWYRVSTYIWLFLGYPVLVVIHSLICCFSWLLVFIIPIAKMNARMVARILLEDPEQVHVQAIKPEAPRDAATLLRCRRAASSCYYKHTLAGVHVFALNLLPLVLVTLILGYVDSQNQYTSSPAKFSLSLLSIMLLSYFTGTAIASISAQSSFAVGAVVNATFGSIIELTLYITALMKGAQEGNRCYEEVVKSALTGTVLGCILLVPGLCMVIGGMHHSEQKLNHQSAGVSSALLFLSVGGVFAPTLFSKVYGRLICRECQNVTQDPSGSYLCHSCRPDLMKNNGTLYYNHVQPLVYTVCLLLPTTYLVGLLFTLKTRSPSYVLHSNCGPWPGPHRGAVVAWPRWRALLLLLLSTFCMSACADLATEHISPILKSSTVSQYFIGVTVLAMVPELPEIVNGIQFALQNHLSLSIEIGSCIAVQVCMLQIPILVLFSIFYPTGFMLFFSDIHVYASMFSVILMNYIFMDGKCDYFRGTVLVMVYFLLLAVYFFAPSPAGC
ncbi:putative cation exchanger C521.04c isoform X2 [Sarcophilus harrisii]|uniref:putative cation exchanger C521.04c isoform X2 n=1 Tax=Sarcophilus harrisii TaxID=9305 RepID=UPI001301C13D|nr:putative cation exchanger C521.04c isoform X2 [Sarcophilus harrisii]